MAERISLRAFDSEVLVRVLSGQLSDFLPVLARQVAHDSPCISDSGVAYWNISCTRDTIIGVLKSINSGSLCVHDTASQEDVITELRRLGASLTRRGRDDSSKKRKCPSDADSCRHDWEPVVIDENARILRPTVTERTANRQLLRRVCSEICTAISKWPRLINAPKPEHGNPLASFSCNSTRCWVQFLDKPKKIATIRKGTMTTREFLKTWDTNRWLRDMLLAIMATRLDVIDETKGELSEIEVCLRVRQTLEEQQCGSHWVVSFDSGYRAHDDPSLLRLPWTTRERQQQIVKSTMMIRKAWDEPDETDGEAISAKAATFYTELIRKEAVESISPVALFSSDCCHGSTPERTALENAFVSQGMKILRWSDGTDAIESAVPALFPPHWNAGSFQTATSPNPSILISFGED